MKGGRSDGRLFCFYLVLLLGFSSSTKAQTLSFDKQVRVKKISESLLSPCCYGEPVSRHMSEVAFQMRKEIEERVLAGQSDREILDYYKGRFGDHILIEPEGTPRAVLYSVPVLMALLGAAVVALFLRHCLMRMQTAVESAPKVYVEARMAEMIRKATDEP